MTSDLLILTEDSTCLEHRKKIYFR